MQMRGVLMLGVIAMGCATTNTPPDGGTDAFPGDAHVCQQGETCDCRAALMIPAGTHWVGVDNDFATPFFRPAHQVTLTRPFWLATYEASAGCYASCVRAGACAGDTNTASSEVWTALPPNYWRDPVFADLPIVGLEPEQADAYCAWLGGRLPTNAESEKATRGEDGRSVPWQPAPADPHAPLPATDLCAHGMAMCGAPVPDAIDTFPMSRGPYGHFHVVGNAREWVADGYADYTAAPAIDPFTPPPGRATRLLRSQHGQGWYRDTYELAGPNLSGVRCAFDTPPAVFPR